MNRWEINHSRGHALRLKELIDKMSTNVESVIILAEILEDSQVIMINTMLFDLLTDARREVLNFTFDSMYNPNPQYPLGKEDDNDHNED